MLAACRVQLHCRHGRCEWSPHARACVLQPRPQPLVPNHPPTCLRRRSLGLTAPGSPPSSLGVLRPPLRALSPLSPLVRAVRERANSCRSWAEFHGQGLMRAQRQQPQQHQLEAGVGTQHAAGMHAKATTRSRGAATHCEAAGLAHLKVPVISTVLCYCHRSRCRRRHQLSCCRRRAARRCSARRGGAARPTAAALRCCCCHAGPKDLGLLPLPHHKRRPRRAFIPLQLLCKSVGRHRKWLGAGCTDPDRQGGGALQHKRAAGVQAGWPGRCHCFGHKVLWRRCALRRDAPQPAAVHRRVPPLVPLQQLQ